MKLFAVVVVSLLSFQWSFCSFDCLVSLLFSLLYIIIITTNIFVILKN